MLPRTDVPRSRFTPAGIRVTVIGSPDLSARMHLTRLRLIRSGMLTLGAWVVFAARSQGAGSLLLPTLATMMVTWTILVWTMRSVSAGDSRTLLFFGIVFRLVTLGAQPVMEDDHHRFLWDGYRFAITGNPYAATPQAGFGDPGVSVPFREILDHLNHPDVATVYGPACQWVFRLCYAVAPGKLWPWKLVLFAAELLLLGFLWRDLSARGRLVLAWCPLAIFETGFNAHPDVLAITLVGAAWWLGRRGRIVSAGAIAGLAITAKIFAVLLVPFVLWRLGRRAWLAAATVVLALYGPFWWRGSAADFTGLRAMAGEWEFNSSIHAIVAALSSPTAARAVCGLAFAAIWLVIFGRWVRSRQASLPPGEWIYGGFLLLSAVANPWYALWLWPFVAMRISGTGLCALAAVSVAYVTGLNLGDTSLGNFGHPWWLRPLEFGLIGCGGLWDWRKMKTRP